MTDKQKFKRVEFYDNGELIKMVTDAETARAIGQFKDICNKIHCFAITSYTLKPRREGFVREAFVAQSHKLKIMCTKEYLPNVPQILNGARYECGILNTKSNKLEMVHGGVQVLYYNLFREHTK